MCVAALLASVQSIQVDVFVAGVNATIPCFRQPVLQPLTKNVVVAFATGRYKTGPSPTLCSDGGDGTKQYVVTRTSLDGGKSFGPMQVVPGLDNPDFYVVQWHGSSGTLRLLVADAGVTRVVSSLDQGVTWSKSSLIQLDTASSPGVSLSHVGPAVGKAIPLGPHLVLAPMVCIEKNTSVPPVQLGGDHGLCPLCRSCIARSTDGGLTWKLGAVAQSGSRESQLALYTSLLEETSEAPVLGEKKKKKKKNDANWPNLYVSERNMGTGNGHRAQSWSRDAGLSVVDGSVNVDLPEPVTANWTGCVGSVMGMWPHGVDLLYSGPASSTTRQNLTIFRLAAHSHRHNLHHCADGSNPNLTLI